MELSSGERDCIKAADWLEAQAVYSGIGQAHVNDIVGETVSDGIIIDEEAQQELDLPLDEDNPSLSADRLATDTEAEIRRRRKLCGDAYPFSFEQGRLDWTNRASPGRWADPYLVCLLAADREMYQPGDDTAQVFEHLTTLALRRFLGGDTVRFGFPRDTMPRPIHEALSKLAELTASELKPNPPVQASDKDISLDVVGWVAFPDLHNNRLQMYVQCTTEAHWENKKGDLSLDEWGRILDWGVPPVKALAIPYVAEEDGPWLRRMSGSLVLDRLRIAAALSGQPLEDGPVVWTDWVERRVRQAADL